MAAVRISCRPVEEKRIGDYKTDSKAIVMFLQYYIKVCIFWVGFVCFLTLLLFEIAPSEIRSIKWYLIFAFIAAPILMSLYMCRVHYPKIFLGRRKQSTIKHNLSLESVLESITSWVQDDNRLTDIDLKSRCTLNHLPQILQNYFPEAGDFEFLLVGSTAEKLNIQFNPGPSFGEVNDDSHALVSDIDYMVTPSNETVSFTKDEATYVLLKDEKLKLGYVYLRENKNNESIEASRIQRDVLKAVREMKVSNFPGYKLPSISCGCFVSDGNHGSARLHGPAVKLKFSTSQFQANRFLADLTFAFKCPEWPEISDWTKRTGKQWPNDEQVERIVSLGCHIVPKSQLGDVKGSTWRLSFSIAEVELCKLAPETARKCYLGLKVIAKDHLSTVYKELSYALKCIFMRTLEQTDPTVWAEENLKRLFFDLLKTLTDAIEKRECPHFWIPQVNLFEDLTKNKAKKLLKKLTEIKKKPEWYIENPYVYT